MEDYKIQIRKVGLVNGKYLILSWKSIIGFGQLEITINEDGEVTADTEGLSREFLRQCLIAFSEIIEIE
jgi:hypothetical protein